MKRPSGISFLAAALAFASAAVSCSTAKMLPQGQWRLKTNKIVIENAQKEDNVTPSDLQPYLKQKSQGWSPLLYVYNWQNGKNGNWDRFVRKLGSEPVVYDSTLVGSSIKNLKDHLEYLGYYNSRIDTSLTALKNRNIRVNYKVTLGRRYPLKEVKYSVLTSGDFRNDFLADTAFSTIKPGTFLSEESLEAETVRSAGAIRNKGYYDFSKNHFRFEADTLSNPGYACLRVIVSEYTRNESEQQAESFEKYHIGKISVSHPENLKIHPKVFRHLTNIHTGDLYRESGVNTLYSRYSSVAMFSSVNIRMTPRPGENTVDCDISLQKGKINGLSLGLEASVNSTGLFGISPELSYVNKNLFKGGEVLSVSINNTNQVKFKDPSVKSNEIGVSASLSLPKMFPVPNSRIRGPNIPRTEIKTSFNYQSRPEFARRMFSASFGYNGIWRRFFRYQINPVSANYVRMPRIDEEFSKSLEKNPFLKNAYQNHTDIGLSSTLYYSTSTSLSPTESYWYSRLNFDISGNILSLFNSIAPKNSLGQSMFLGVPYSQYLRSELALGRTLVWGEKSGQSLAMRIMGGIGYAYGNSTAIPFEKHFYCGGANSLRGWTARTVGPGSQPLNSAWVIPNQTGDVKLEANIEYRLRLLWKLSGAIFLDCGNVWNIGRNANEQTRFSLSTIAASWGYGLRLDLSFIVLRVDMGLRIYDPSTRDRWVDPGTWYENAYAVHFGVGYPF